MRPPTPPQMRLYLACANDLTSAPSALVTEIVGACTTDPTYRQVGEALVANPRTPPDVAKRVYAALSADWDGSGKRWPDVAAAWLTRPENGDDFAAYLSGPPNEMVHAALCRSADAVLLCTLTATGGQRTVLAALSNAACPKILALELIEAADGPLAADLDAAGLAESPWDDAELSERYQMLLTMLRTPVAQKLADELVPALRTHAALRPLVQPGLRLATKLLIVERWLAPQLVGKPWQTKRGRRALEATETLLYNGGPYCEPVAKELIEALGVVWEGHRSKLYGALSRELGDFLDPIGSRPAKTLWDLSPADVATLMARAGVDEDDLVVWRTVVALTDTFTGTLAQLFASAVAIGAGPQKQPPAA